MENSFTMHSFNRNKTDIKFVAVPVAGVIARNFGCSPKNITQSDVSRDSDVLGSHRWAKARVSAFCRAPNSSQTL